MRLKCKFLSLHLLLLSFVIVMIGCKKEGYKIPDPVSSLTNDGLKRTLGPNIVNMPIEFTYAMALPKSKGKLVSAQVEASIAGGTGTYLENNSYYTNLSGTDIPVRVGSPSVNKDNITSVAFNVDTNASTLRYYYIVPEAARGKEVSFTFSATSSDGSTVNYKLGPYTISKMDIKRTMAVSNNNLAYISIENMTVYNSTDAAANAGKIDLVYLYRASPTSFTHALVSPAAEAQYLPGVTLPAGVNRNTKVRRVFSLQEYNLARINVGIFIDDRDFQELNLTDAPNYAIGLRAESGTWIETADGKYRAYIFLNSINSNGSAVISMLRYPL